MSFIFFFLGFCLGTKNIVFDSQNQYKVTDIVSENNTYIIQDLSQKYFYITLELEVKDIDFFLFVSVGQVITQFSTYYQDWIHIDWNSQYENRLTRFIKVESEEQFIYITTSGQKPQQYNLSVIGSLDVYFCSNNCSNNGVCTIDGCFCHAPYIGDDCHQKAIETNFDEETSIVLEKEGANFFYRLDYFPWYSEGQIEFKINCDSGIILAFELTDALYIPEDFNLQYSSIIELNKIYPNTSLTKSTNDYQTFTSVFVVLQIAQNEDCTLQMTATFDDVPGDSSQNTTTIIIIITCVVAVFFILLIFCIYKKLREYLKNLSEQRFINLRNAAATLPTVQVIEHLVPMTDKQIKGDDTCAICLDSLSNKKEVRQTPCHHNFHTDCLKLWLEKTLKCPTCRTSLTNLLHHE